MGGSGLSSNQTWDVGKLKDVADIVMGQSPKGETCNSVGDGVPLLNGPTEFGVTYPEPIQYTTDPKKKAKQGDLLFCVRGSTVGRMNWADQEYAIGRGLASISSKENECRHFIKALIDYNLSYILNISTGSTFPNVTRDMLNDLPVLLPTNEEQKFISGIFESIAEKIELNNAIIKNLEEMAQALFKRWFVDFEFPNENGEPYKSSGGEFEESELGLIPRGWRVGILSELGKIVGGATPSKKNEQYYTKKGIPWITPKDLSQNKNKYIERGEIDISEEGFRNSSVKLLPKGTVLFSSRAPIGYIAISNIEVTTNQGFKSLIPNENIGSEFAYYLLKNNIDNIESRASGSTFKEISGTEMKKVPAVIPDFKVISEFNRIIEPIGNLMKKCEEENEKLIIIRDTLLPKLMSGEIRVPVNINK